MLNESQGRHISATMDTATAIVTSPSLGGNASAAEVDLTKDKMLTMMYTGAGLQAFATNGKVKLEILAHENPLEENRSITISNIHIDQFKANMNLPISMRVGKGYRYGFNGMERDDEISGSGNSYNTEFRGYDTRLGRWMSLDPLEAKYSSLSPYNYVANSPLIFVDFDGRDLKFTVGIYSSRLKWAESLIASGIGVDGVVEITPQGDVQLKTLNSDELGKLTTKQQVFYKTIKEAVDSKKTIAIGIEDKSEDVLIGSRNLRKIDKSDIDAFKEDGVVSKYSTFAHEVKEQTEIQENITESMTKEEVKDAKAAAHTEGEIVEEDMSGYKRGKSENNIVRSGKGGSLKGYYKIPYKKGEEVTIVKVLVSKSNVTSVTKEPKSK